MSKFGDAFKAARSSGKKVFSFGGKSYTTKMKGETSSGASPASQPAAPVRAKGQPVAVRAKGQPAAGTIGIRGKPTSLAVSPKSSTSAAASSPAKSGKPRALNKLKTWAENTFTAPAAAGPNRGNQKWDSLKIPKSKLPNK